MQSVNIIGSGRVGRSLMMLFQGCDGICIGDVCSSSIDSAEAAVAEVGLGRPVAGLADMAPAEIWLLTVPDDQIDPVAEALANTGKQPATALHFSGFTTSEALAPLRKRGWSVASCHPVLSFNDPAQAARSFAGTHCGIEGDTSATAETLVRRIGGLPFPIHPDRKPLYHAAAVFSNNFTVLLQAIAREAWRDAGVPDDVATALCDRLLRGATDGVATLGPSAALTGPAARGDDRVLALQEEAVRNWQPEAGALYALASQLARRLGQTGHPFRTDQEARTRT